MYLLGFQIFFDAPGTEFASEARLFVAAPRRFHISGLHVINPDDTGAQSLHRAKSFEDVPRPHCRCQAVGRVVCNSYRIFVILERNDSCDGPKNFFAGDAGRVVHIIKNRRLDVVAFGELFGAAAPGG